MALTQESILTFLLKQDGKAKNSDFLSEFKGLLNCSDLAEKKQNRELFKHFVNNIAVVKEIEGEKHIVLKKRYAHLLKEITTLTDQKTELGESSDVSPDSPGEQSVPRDSEGKESSNPANSNVSSLSDTNNDNFNYNKESSPVERALQRSIYMDSVKLRTETLNISSIDSCKVLQINSSKDNEENSSVLQAMRIDKTDHTGASAPQKPYMLPLRMPATTRQIITYVPEPNAQGEPSGTVNKDQELEKSPRTKRRMFEEILTPSSPQSRRGLKNAKPTDEPKYSSIVPLESMEHEWLVKSAAGHWSQVHGLLLQDAQLALKKDFMSGFTALHWAAKGGNCEMARTIIELCQRGQADFDVNTKSHGGYTALHIAAIHDHQQVIVLLIRDYGANIDLRDNNGKKAYHYLHKGVSSEVRELLGEPQVLDQECAHEKNGDDHFAEISKGFSTIGKLFQPYTVGSKKKYKQRTGFQPVNEDLEDENDDCVPRNRSLSDVFKQGGLTPY